MRTERHDDQAANSAGRPGLTIWPVEARRAAIKGYEARNAATFTSKLVIRGESYMASGPLGIERGTYTFGGKAKEGAAWLEAAFLPTSIR